MVIDFPIFVIPSAAEGSLGIVDASFVTHFSIPANKPKNGWFVLTFCDQKVTKSPGRD